MNLLFRKNFREGASKSAGGGSKLQSKANRTKRSRDTGGGINSNEDIHYRTHLFFAPSRGGYEPPEVENRDHMCSRKIKKKKEYVFYSYVNTYIKELIAEKCSGISGFSNQLPSTATAQSSQFVEVDAPQPLVDRRPSVSLLRWNQSIKVRNDNSTNLTVNQLNSSTNQLQANQLHTPNTTTPLSSLTTMSTASYVGADRQGLNATRIYGNHCHYTLLKKSTYLHVLFLLF